MRTLGNGPVNPNPARVSVAIAKSVAFSRNRAAAGVTMQESGLGAITSLPIGRLLPVVRLGGLPSTPRSHPAEPLRSRRPGVNDGRRPR
jgi:hypothetical protein